jgi:LysM repeat protein
MLIRGKIAKQFSLNMSRLQYLQILIFYLYKSKFSVFPDLQKLTMSSKNHSNTTVFILKNFSLFFLLLSLFSNNVLAFSILGFSIFKEEEKVEKSSTSLQSFKGLNVEDLEKIEVKKEEFKKGTGQNLQNIKMSLVAGEDIVETLQDSTDGGTGSTDNEIIIYTVAKGDTLQSIATYFAVTKDTILTVNEDVIEDGKVSVGDVLEIHPISGLGYNVSKGDTLAKIAEKYNLNSEDISLYNGIIDSSALVSGDLIFLPGAKMLKEDLKTNEKKLAIKDKTTGKNVKDKVITKITKTISDVAAIVKLKKEGKNFSTLPKLGGYFINPAPGAVRTQKMHGHNGVDLAARVGTPILASAGGTITVARDTGWNYGYGKYIVINHSNGTQTVYAHLSVINVSVGQTVAQGERIASMGNTGNSTGPHVHFEVRGAFNSFAW